MLLITHDYPVGTGASTGYWYESYYYEIGTDLLEEYESFFAIAGGSNRGIEIVYEYYDLQVLHTKTLSVMNSTCQNIVTYTYEINGTRHGSQIASYSSQMGSVTPTTYTFTYDQKGNITQIVDSSAGTVRYTYDDLNQLIREDNPYVNNGTGATYVYTYNNSGNRTSKTTYAYTTASALGPILGADTYLYEDGSWGDRLTSYNGTSITYDAIGNPESYYNGFSFTWSDGRRLTGASNGQYSLNFTYNDEGIRTSKYIYNAKTDDEVTHYYTLDGSRIISEQWGNHFIAYLYDESGAPIGMQYRTSSYAENVFDTFYFEKNLQGDIVAVYNSSGTKLVTYKYDAWGNHTTTYSNGGNTTGAQYNPFRYRGYYYDTDLGLYYLNSRYYDSNTGRFLNADVYINANGDLIGFNMFAYCSNNPIVYIDASGSHAIYVVDYSKLPIVGHAFLYIEDANGVWHKTQFASRSSFKKKDAIVYSMSYSSFDEMCDELMDKFKNGNISVVFLFGDYSEGANEALRLEDMNDNGFNGEYNLFTNNCLHYVKHILSKGNDMMTDVDKRIKNSNNIVPALFYGELSIVQLQSIIKVLKGDYSNINSFSGPSNGGGFRGGYDNRNFHTICYY